MNLDDRVNPETVNHGLFKTYMANIFAYLQGTKIIGVKGEQYDIDEELMHSLEKYIEIPEAGVDDFRRSIAAFAGIYFYRNTEMQWDSNLELAKAIRLFLDSNPYELITEPVPAHTTQQLDPKRPNIVDGIITYPYEEAQVPAMDLEK